MVVVFKLTVARPMAANRRTNSRKLAILKALRELGMIEANPGS
jgi:hypothetical protein